ncbi:MAG: RNA methyltransferase [Rhizobiaceae bacterium]
MSEAAPRPGQVKEITSLANPVVKDIKALALKKNRDASGTFVAEGLKLAIDALDAGWTLKILVIGKAAKDNPLAAKTAARALARGVLVLEASEKVLVAISRRDNPQGVIGVFGQRWHDLTEIRPAPDKVWVALDRVRDPGNLGTIIRTADAAGASGVILIGETTDPFALETVRATMGSVFAIPLYRANEQGFLDFRKKFGGLAVGTHLQGSVDYRTVNYAGKPLLLVMGNEQSGLTPALAQGCDQLIRIPQDGKADSLNLAVATGIALYETRRHLFKTDHKA